MHEAVQLVLGTFEGISPFCQVLLVSVVFLGLVTVAGVRWKQERSKQEAFFEPPACINTYTHRGPSPRYKIYIGC